MEKFRLYIDESGTHDYCESEDIKHRYLGLLGLIISEKSNIDVLQPALLDLKRIIASDPDDLPILHREDIVNKRGDFAKLNDESIKEKFNEKFISILKDTDYAICAVVLDKQSHLKRYDKSALHPYHYCLTVLLERYVFYLKEKEGCGDVLAEARGKKEDQALKDVYTNFYEDGTFFCSSKHIQKFLTSREIKIKPKSYKYAGLEFADLLALASKLDTLKSYSELTDLTDNFCKIIINNIQNKYRHSQLGKIIGFGKKFIS